MDLRTDFYLLKCNFFLTYNCAGKIYTLRNQHYAIVRSNFVIARVRYWHKYNSIILEAAASDCSKQEIKPPAQDSGDVNAGILLVNIEKGGGAVGHMTWQTNSLARW